MVIFVILQVDHADAAIPTKLRQEPENEGSRGQHDIEINAGYVNPASSLSRKSQGMVLAPRFKKIIPKLISENQGAFIADKQILDEILTAGELIDSRFKSKQPGVLCKLDIQKAFDNVSWHIMSNVLKSSGFGDKWISWMQWCVSSAQQSILVNGSSTTRFKPQKGIRQGDLLSPFLFILIPEIFTKLMKNAVQLNMISGFSINSVQVSHLQYADDTLVFLNGYEEESENLVIILQIFEAITGLKVAWEKACKPKSLGGLGIKNLKLTNKALLAKWSWRFSKEKKQLWRRIIHEKMQTQENAIWVKDSNKPQGKRMWKNIQKQKQVVEQITTTHLNKGDSVSFWWDAWAGTQSLKIQFPNIYKIATSKNATIKEMISNNAWNLKLRRNLTQREIPEMMALFATLGTPPYLNEEEEEDELVCTTTGGFNVQLCYKWLIEQLPVTPATHSPVSYSCIWIQGVPTKVQFFIWTAAQNSIATTDNLKRWIISYYIVLMRKQFGIISLEDSILDGSKRVL
ncbi:uncharacterized protein LOC113294785 [Papaver somniferum]|uniref:uncharacterized protein LOC113294785 n=1 Tax=Papaver somniferum TaxID=3469 RepID=UPI000E70466A|nr:uncharacterized protein LOC113294785 [Papaver somniferum]